MTVKNIFAAILPMLLIAASCDDEEPAFTSLEKNREVVITEELVSTDFVGNGAQWGGYEMTPTWLGTETLSDADWNTLFKRIDFMRPPFLRIVTNPAWSYDNNGTYDETTKTVSLFKMLDYAKDRDIEITFGEWGHSSTDDISTIDMSWIENSVKFLNHLVNEKGYTNIKTINIINEPNGDRSSTLR